MLYRDSPKQLWLEQKALGEGGGEKARRERNPGGRRNPELCAPAGAGRVHFCCTGEMLQNSRIFCTHPKADRLAANNLRAIGTRRGRKVGGHHPSSPLPRTLAGKPPPRARAQAWHGIAHPLPGTAPPSPGARASGGRGGACLTWEPAAGGRLQQEGERPAQAPAPPRQAAPGGPHRSAAGRRVSLAARRQKRRSRPAGLTR